MVNCSPKLRIFYARNTSRRATEKRGRRQEPRSPPLKYTTDTDSLLSSLKHDYYLTNVSNM